MQRKKLGVAAVWMVCLLGMVAVVWSRPPMGSSEPTHPPLALSAPQIADSPTIDQPVSQPVPKRAQPIAQPVSQPVPQPTADLPPINAVPEPVPVQQVISTSTTVSPVLPEGEWVRDLKPMKVSFRIKGHRLHFSLSGVVDDEVEGTLHASADYHVTKDYIAYGVITSASVEIGTAGAEDRLEADASAQMLMDRPFAMRFRVDEGTLTIKDFKIGLNKEIDDLQETGRVLIPGTYRQAALAEQPARNTHR